MQIDLDGLLAMQMKREQERFDSERDNAESVVELVWQVDAMMNHDLDYGAEHERRVHGDVLCVAFFESPRMQQDCVGHFGSGPCVHMRRVAI